MINENMNVHELLKAFNGDIMLADVSPIQTKILNALRLTEDFKRMYTEYLFTDYPDGVAMKQAVKAIKKYENLSAVDLEENKSLICDYLYARLVLGFLSWEFFSYGLEGKSIAECLEFMPNRNIFTYYGALNKDKQSNRTLDVKYATYQHFQAFFKREVIQVKDSSDKNMFFDFCSRHNRFIIKPVNLALGRGIRIVNGEDFDNSDTLFSDVLSSCTEKSSVVCEELINQHHSFSQIHPESVNSIRIFTYVNESDVSVVCAWLKAGQGSAVIDNGGAGGMVAAIDEKTGIVTTDAANENAQVFSVHPDTGFVFKGFQIPKWDELIDMAKEIALMLPDAHLVGWDCALSEDKGWQLIEGNKMGQIVVAQVATKRGMLKELTQKFEWDKHKKHIKI